MNLPVNDLWQYPPQTIKKPVYFGDTGITGPLQKPVTNDNINS
jgi:hypothetical protein